MASPFPACGEGGALRSGGAGTGLAIDAGFADSPPPPDPLPARGRGRRVHLRTKRYSTTRKEPPMSLYDATVPAFLQILGSLTGILNKAEAHCKAKNIAQAVLLSARLYQDMLPFSTQ